MNTTKILSEATEQLACAQFNFDNLIRAAPFLKNDPLYRIARYQLDEGVRMLRGEPSQEIALTDEEKARIG